MEFSSLIKAFFQILLKKRDSYTTLGDPSTTDTLQNLFLNNAVMMFDGNPTSSKCIKNNGTCAYEYISDNREYILRIIERKEGWNTLIQAELDWINYLWDNGVNVCRPINSIRQNQIEIIKSNNSMFFISSFEKAKGKFVDFNSQREWNGELFQNWGAVMGKIHSLSKDYIIETESPRRMEWDKWDVLYDPHFSLGKNEEIVVQKWKELVKELRSYPRNKDNYGLIHHDFHHRNFFLDGSDISLFDFDDCCYCWFICDIAISLYDAVVGSTLYEKRNSFGEFFLTNFLTGYRTEKDIEEFWIDLIPKFLKYRQISSYISYYRSWKNPNKEQKNLLVSLKFLIENDIPCWNVPSYISRVDLAK